MPIKLGKEVAVEGKTEREGAPGGIKGYGLLEARAERATRFGTTLWQ